MMTPHRKSPTHYVIVGNSAAGLAAAGEIRRWDAAGRITVVSDEPTFGYSRVMLPLYIAGKIGKKDMLIAPRSFYASKNIKLLRPEKVESMDARNQRVETDRGTRLPYDRLLVATGASPRRLGVEGEDLRGIYTLRKMADAEAIRSEIRAPKGAVLVIGGGLVSVKSVEALVARRKSVHLVISSRRILSQMLDQEASDLFARVFEGRGVTIHFQMDVKAFQGKERVERAVLADGRIVACSLAILGKGVEPNTHLLREAGAAMSQGVLVDDHMATSLPSVYAAGDVAEQYDIVEGKHSGHALWPLAVEGGRVAGSNMAGVSTVSPGAVRMNSVDILGTRVVTAGGWEGQDIRTFQKETAFYRKLVFAGDRLQGFVLAGDIRGAGVLTSLIRSQTEVSVPMLEEGLGRGFSYGPRLGVLGGRIERYEVGGGVS